MIRALAATIAAMLAAAVAGAAQSPRYPSPAAPWAQGDYVNFYFTHYNGNFALPHLRSAEGRAVFARLTDPANIARIIQNAGGPEAKRRQLSVILASLGAARAAYNGALIAGEPLSEELARLQIFLVAVIDARAGLGGEEASRAAWKTSLLGVARSVAEGGSYTEDQRARIASALAAHAPLFAALLGGGEKSGLADAMAGLAEAAGDDRLRKACGSLAAALRRS